MKFKEIFKDKRGSINTLTEDMKFEEITVFTTKKGLARGGCIHEKNDEYTCVIEGKVEYYIGSKKLVLVEGQSAVIPSSTPHYFISITDSIVLEWGATPIEKANKYPRFRKIVDAINKKYLINT